MSDQSCDFLGRWQILVGHCPMTDSYLQPWATNIVYLFPPSFSMCTFCSTLSTGLPVMVTVKEMFIKAFYLINFNCKIKWYLPIEPI